MAGIGYIHDGKEFFSHVDGKTFKDRKIKPLNYSLTFKEMSEKQYDEVSRYLGEASHHTFFGEGNIYYFLDEGETLAVRTDGKNKIEISDLVDQDIIDSVKHILNSEKRGNDLN